MTETNEKVGEVRVVTDDDLGQVEYLTQRGFELVQVVSPVERLAEVYIDSRGNHVRHFTGGVEKTVLQKLNGAHYVLVRGRDTALAEALAALEDAQQSVRNLAEGVQKTTREKLALEEEREKLVKKLADLRAVGVQQDRTNVELGKKLDKMERDLGKLREVLGSERFNEITNGKRT